MANHRLRKQHLERVLHNLRFIPNDVFYCAIVPLAKHFFHVKLDTCTICYEECWRAGEFADLDGCGHKLCVYCLEKYINEQILNGNVQIMCPFCTSQIEPSFVMKTVPRLPAGRQLSQRLETAYIQGALKKMRDLFYCQTSGCEIAVWGNREKDDDFVQRKVSLFGWEIRAFRRYESSSNTGADLRKFKCPDCRYSYCVVCRSPWTVGNARHEQISCSNYEKTFAARDEATKEWERQHTKECPNCKSRIQKNGGCPHMQCRSCKHHFCWGCLRPYPNQCQGCRSGWSDLPQPAGRPTSLCIIS
eukprot:TRINITY_DN8526_c0_g1_i1.p1 TRINITY_DN8526_c0_g1~~TRINITY_DN8526_c0_g1_i1.p1  ORF type:complete len:344 (-),score=31.08 TRINITY_DN8526_c0_g1_i1:415-1323(-)